MQLRLAMLAAIVALTSCAAEVRVVRMRGRDIHSALSNLRSNGSATVDTSVQSDGEVLTAGPVMVRPDSLLLVHGEWISVAKLTEHCSTLPPFRKSDENQDCELVRNRDGMFAMRTTDNVASPTVRSRGRYTNTPLSVLVMLSAAAVGIASPICIAKCDSPIRYISIAGIPTALVLVLVACSLKEGCHD
jgi:hypothetical protein